MAFLSVKNTRVNLQILSGNKTGIQLKLIAVCQLKYAE